MLGRLDWLLATPWRTVLIAAIILALPIVALGELAASDSRSRAQAAELRKHSDATRKAADLLSLRFSQLGDEMAGANTNASLRRALEIGDGDGLAIVVRDIRAAMGREVIRLLVLDASGVVAAVYPQDGSILRTDESQRDAFAMLNRLHGPGYRYVVSRAHAQGADALPLVDIASPSRTFSHGQVLSGVLLAEVDLGGMAAAVASLLEQLEDVYVVDGEGRFVARARWTPSEPPPDLRSLYGHPAIASALSGLHTSLEQPDPLTGRTRLVATAPLPVGPPSLVGTTTYGEIWHWQVVGVSAAPLVDPQLEAALGQLSVLRLGLAFALLAAAYVLSRAYGTIFYQRGALAAANAELVRTSKAKSDFLANMSHELRTPLNAVLGFTEVLLDRMFGSINEKQDEYLRDIRSSGRHLLDLINEILDLSKVEAGRMELSRSEFDLPELLRNSLVMIRERAARHSIALGLEVEPQIMTIHADERKLKQVVFNLLANAVKFTPDGGRIDVTCAMRAGSVEIAVRDTGVGIAPEDQARIFEEFAQARAGRKDEGTGLGLALAKRFVELHEGRLSLISEVGVGSTFTLTIPVGVPARDEVPTLGGSN